MSDNDKRKPHFLDEYDNGEYLGNIFGWKVSFIGLAVILLLLALVWFRWNPQPTSSDTDSQKQEVPVQGSSNN